MARPTASITSRFSTNGATFTPPLNARGMMVSLHGNPASAISGFTHAMTGCTFGGVALTLDESRTQTASHTDMFYLGNYASFIGRSSNVLSFTGGTMGTANTQYQGYIIWLLHPTHTVSFVDAAGANSIVSNATAFSATAVIPAGVDVLLVHAMRCNTITISAVVSQAGQTHLVDEAFAFCHTKVDTEQATGSAAGSFTNSSGANLTMAIISYGWKEGTPVAPRNASRMWAFGALPEVALPILPLGLQAARAIPVGA